MRKHMCKLYTDNYNDKCQTAESTPFLGAAIENNITMRNSLHCGVTQTKTNIILVSFSAMQLYS